MKLRALVLAIGLLIFGGLAVYAQSNYVYPTNPTPSGYQTTPFATNYFTATFNGTVVSDSSNQPSTTSTETVYYSNDHQVYQDVTVRIINHDISIDTSSSNFYIDQDPLTLAGTTPTNRGTGEWGPGTVFSYGFWTYTDPSTGVTMTKRERAIVVNSRVVIFIEQITPRAYDAQTQWLDFEYSLRIK